MQWDHFIKGVEFGPIQPPYYVPPLKMEARAAFGLRPSFEFGMTRLYENNECIVPAEIDSFFEPFFASSLGVLQGNDPVMGLWK